MSRFLNHFNSQASQPRSFSVCIAGQSLARAYVNRDCFAVLSEQMRLQGSVQGLIRQINVASGGSSINRYGQPAGSQNYWWDSDNNEPGPLLIEALEDLDGQKVNLIIWDLGQTDSLYFDSTQTIERFKSDYISVLNALYNKANEHTDSDARIIMQLIGRRDGYNIFDGIQKVREVQLAVLSELPELFIGSVDTYDVERIDGVHPSNIGYAEIGSRVALMYAGAYNTPEIESITKSDDYILVTLSQPIKNSVNSEIVGFRGRTKDGYIDLRAVVTTSTSLRLYTISDADSGFINSVVYPFDTITDYTDKSTLPINTANLPLKTSITAI